MIFFLPGTDPYDPVYQRGLKEGARMAHGHLKASLKKMLKDVEKNLLIHAATVTFTKPDHRCNCKFCPLKFND